jgi:hypothetical protein
MFSPEMRAPDICVSCAFCCLCPGPFAGLAIEALVSFIG